MHYQNLLLICLTRKQKHHEQNQFAQLLVFKQKFGHCSVPLSKANRTSLSHWVNWQREMLRTGRIASAREARLTSLGFLWNKSCLWTIHFLELARFRMDFGHCDVPRRWAQDPHLGSWVSWLRQTRKRNKILAARRVEMLESLGFRWELWDPRFGRRFAACHLPSQTPELSGANKAFSCFTPEDQTASGRVLDSQHDYRPEPSPNASSHIHPAARQCSAQEPPRRLCTPSRRRGAARRANAARAGGWRRKNRSMVEVNDEQIAA